MEVKGVRELLRWLRGRRDEAESGGDTGRLAGIAAAIAVANRLRLLWRNNVVSTFTTGQAHNPNDPWLMWEIGRTEKHCADCLRFNGQIHRASTWRASGAQPQGTDLECGGWNCDCSFIEMPGHEGGDVGSIG